MVATSYTRTPASSQDLRRHTDAELQRIAISIRSLVELLQQLDVPIEIGANDSGGTGYRVLRIPNA